MKNRRRRGSDAVTDEGSRDGGFGIDRRKVLQGAALAAAVPAAGALAQAARPANATPNRLKAVAVNFQPILGDNKATAAKMTGIIENAARDGANLIVFPEMALQGFERCQDCKNRGSACDRHLAGAELAD